MPDAGAGSRLRSWAYALRTTNPPADGPTDTVTRWLVVTRAAVLPMTLVSGLVAGLLAIGEPGLDWRWLVLWWESHAPHIANNLMNDLYDTDVGTDSATYARPLCPAPGRYRGQPCRIYHASTNHQLRLTRACAGTYYAAVGAGGWEVVLASLPYGLLCTTVLMGKHIDKIGYDEPLGIRTLPVLLGETCARTVTLAMMVGFYLLIAVNVMLAAMPWPRCWSPGRCPGWRKCGPISCDGGPSSRHRRFRCGRCGMPRWPGCTCVRPVRCWLWAWRSVPGGAPGDFR